MSALTPLPSPRPHAVSAASARKVKREEEELFVASRPHLRLVTDDFVPETSRADPVVELPVELARRPAAPRAAPSARREGRAVQARPADLAPHHPAVRAQRRRQLEAQQSRSVVAHGADGADGARGKASAPRVQDSAQRLPIGLRRLVVTGGLVLVAALIVSLGIVMSGFADAPSRTTTATVQSGQSLWEVAVATGTGDVDRTMSRIVELNGLESSALQAGQVLVVPAE